MNKFRKLLLLTAGPLLREKFQEKKGGGLPMCAEFNILEISQLWRQERRGLLFNISLGYKMGLKVYVPDNYLSGMV